MATSRRRVDTRSRSTTPPAPPATRKGVVYHHRGAYLNALVQHHRLGHAAPRGLSVDAADVPLQRLVLRVDDGRQRRHQRLPAPGRSQGDLRRDPRAQGHPLLRRADRARDADQRARDAARGYLAQGQRAGCGGRTAGVGHRGDGAHGVRHHPCLRADRNVRARGGVRQARRMGCARHRRAHRAQRPAGRALHVRGGHDGHGLGDDGRSAVGWRDHGRDHVSRQHRHEGLPEEPGRDRRGLRAAAGSTPATSR